MFILLGTCHLYSCGKQREECDRGRERERAQKEEREDENSIGTLGSLYFI